MEAIKFIEGEFTPNEAKEILLDIISKKINFHNLKNLSSQVRYNQPDVESQTRIRELSEAKAQILSLIQEAKDENINLVIESTLNISFEAKGLPQPLEVCLQAEAC